MPLPADRSHADRASLGCWVDRKVRLKSISKEERNSIKAAAPITYPMYGMSMERFLDLNPDIPLPPHQELLRDGLLTVCEEQTKVIFVSHEWLSYNHIDPNGEQVRALQALFRRLISGELEIDAERTYQACLPKRKRPYLSSADRKELFPQMYVWLDWISMPQSESCEPAP